MPTSQHQGIRRRGWCKNIAAAGCLAIAGIAEAATPANGAQFVIWDSTGRIVHGEAPVPKAIHAPKAEYPRRLAELGVRGWAKVRFTITEDGAVRNAEVVETRPRRHFARAALRTIMRYRFERPMLNGMPAALHDVTARLVFDPEGGRR